MEVVVKKTSYIVVDQERCKGCYLCMDACPRACIAVSQQLNAAGYYPAHMIEDAACTACALCATVCPDVAIEVYKGE